MCGHRLKIKSVLFYIAAPGNRWFASAYRVGQSRHRETLRLDGLPGVFRLFPPDIPTI